MSETRQRLPGRVEYARRMTNRSGVAALRRPPFYHGWLVVTAAFLIAMFGFGLGFYGPGVYLIALQARDGWSVDELVPAITVYYALGAGLLFFCVGPLFERCGTRRVVTTGVVAMATGLLLQTMIFRRWQVYAAFAVMALGWATMSGAAINIIVAPWFDKRRGLAVSWSLNGANAGGIIVVPLLTFLIARFGFVTAMRIAVGAMIAILVPVGMLVLRPKRADECDCADRGGALQSQAGDKGAETEGSSWALSVVGSLRFQTISIPFALALTAQVGLLTLQLAYLSPLLGTAGAGWAVSLTALAAVAGRTATGLIIDKIDRRMAACGNFLVQAVGTAVLATSQSAPMLFFGCALFGLGVGNTTLLPSLIVHQEFPRRFFARIVSLVVAINQFTFAFGPSLLGYLRQATGSYTISLVACLIMETLAAAIVLLPVLARSMRKQPFVPACGTRP